MWSLPYGSVSNFRIHQNKYLRSYTTNLKVGRVLNLGAMPDAPDKEGTIYETYFPNSEFRTLDLGDNSSPRHIAADLMVEQETLAPFDLVLAMSVIEHIDRPWLAAPNITRMIKPGGHLYVAMPFFYPVHEGPYYGDHWRATPSAIRHLFDELEEVKHDLYPSSILAIRDRKTYWQDPRNHYAGFSMLLRRPLV